MRSAWKDHLADLLGASRLAADGVGALADLVERAHGEIQHGPRNARARLGGISGLVYRRVRGTARLVGRAADALTPGAGGAPDGSPAEAASSARRDAALAALNGVLGDHLAATANPLATRTHLVHGGQPLGAAPLPANPRVVVLVHGLCLGHRQWRRRGHDHGEALARDLGVAPVYLHYNTGLHVSANGRAFSAALEALLGRWPVPVAELTVVAHSMGGLVTRSACHQAAALGHGWPGVLRRVVCLGTPHHGAPLERAGQRTSLLLREVPYVAPYARLGRLRSAGVTDLRHGNLLDEDWAGGDRFDGAGDRRRAVPLPAGAEFHALAATLHDGTRDLALGDGLVPVASALGDHADPARALGLGAARRWVGRGMHHFDLLDHPAVYAQLRDRVGAR